MTRRHDTEDAVCLTPVTGLLMLAILGVLWTLWYPFDVRATQMQPWLGDGSLHRINLAGNVVMFLPVGAVMTWWLTLRGWRGWTAMGMALLLGLILSLAGETMQAWMPDRQSSPLDLIANVGGAILGGLFGLVWATRLSRTLRHWLGWVQQGRTRRALLWVLAVTAFCRWVPFDLSPETRELRLGLSRSLDAGPPFAATLASLRHHLGWTPAVEQELLSATVTLVLMLAVAWAISRVLRETFLSRNDRTSPTLFALLFGGMVLAVTELGQWPVVSRVMDATDGVAGAMGLVAGTLLESMGWSMRVADGRGGDEELLRDYSREALPRSVLPVSDIPGSDIPGAAPAGSTLGVISPPVAALPMSAARASMLPLSAIPGSELPLSELPGSAVRLSAIPLSELAGGTLPGGTLPGGGAARGSTSSRGSDGSQPLLSSAELRRVPPQRFHLALATLGAIALVIYGSLVPFHFQGDLYWLEGLENFSPPHLSLSVYSRADLVANIVLFVPLGFLGVGTLAMDRKSRWRLLALGPIVWAVLAALAVGLECLQQWFPPRTVSLNDIEAECLGAAVGIMLWALVGPAVLTWLRRTLAAFHGPRVVQRALQAYVVGLVLYQLMPLDVVLSLREWRTKVALGRVQLLPLVTGWDRGWGQVWDLGADALLFVPVGMLLTLGWRGRSWRSVVRVAGLAAAIGLVIELVQLPIFTRFTDSTDILIATLGGTAGAILTRWGWPRWFGPDAVPSTPGSVPPQAPTAPRKTMPSITLHLAMGLCLAGLYSGLLALIYWHPWRLVSDQATMLTKLQGLGMPPFAEHYAGTEFNALGDVLQALMLAFPLGGILQWTTSPLSLSRLLRRSITFTTLLGVALGIEAGQAAFIGRYPDSTDVLVLLTGGVAGAWFMARVRSQVHAEKGTKW